ncbi:MAG: hypothetical protein JHC95_15860 [Solirubrobacteraceae bacterium]|nr:hypothetical protein [Solirubrobacteraceae bacterium]
MTLSPTQTGSDAPAEPPARLGRLPLRTLEWVGLALLILVGVVGYFAYPTWPNYDSIYSLVWGRELLDGTTMSFDAYRAPTEHPLAIAVGAALSIFGEGGDRMWTALCIATFVWLVCGLYTLGKELFTPLVGLLAALLLLTRFDFPFYAVRGYIDPAYLALVIWAAVMEVRRPRRGLPVLGMLVLAGLLRPEAWLLGGLYWLYLLPKSTWKVRIWGAALVWTAPFIWALTDFIVTGDPLFSQTHTSELADELGRNKGLEAVPGALWGYLSKLAKFPVMMGAIAGTAIAVTLVPTRLKWPLALFLAGVGTFAAVGAAGLSVIDRYLLVASLMLMLMSAVAIGGWTMLERGWLRRIWMVGAVVLVAFGVAFTVDRVNVNRLENELTFRGDSHRALESVLANERVREALKCGPVFVPNHKLLPDVRWDLNLPEDQVIARADPDAPEPERGVAILIHGRAALFNQLLVNDRDRPGTNLPPPGFERVAVSQYYAAYVRC